MRLGLIITQRCNAQCLHCYSSCGPHETKQLSESRLLQLIDDSAACTPDDALNISISGGEPFLFPALLQRLISRGNAHGAWMSCVSNGSWAHNPTKAQAILQPLHDAGLDALDISYSEFHRAYVPENRIKHALGAAISLGLHSTLKYVETASSSGAEICRWAEEAGADHVQRIALLPALRTGAKLPDSTYSRREGLPGGACPGPLLSIREDGSAYGCCTPGAHTRWHHLGNVHAQTLTHLQQRYISSPRLRLLRREGPIALAKAVQTEGLGHLLRTSYVNACELCTHITSDPTMAKIARSTAERRDVQNLTAILQALPDNVSETPPPSTTQEERKP